jgi:hypothetical protein
LLLHRNSIRRGFQLGVIVAEVDHDGRLWGRHSPILILEVVVPKVVGCHGGVVFIGHLDYFRTMATARVPWT